VKPLTDAEAGDLIEGAIDILFEVGNGTTDEDLGRAMRSLFRYRDEWRESHLAAVARLRAAARQADQTLTWLASGLAGKRFHYNGVEQDPSGIHGSLAALRAALEEKP
jgi:hypothetical protein